MIMYVGHVAIIKLLIMIVFVKIVEGVILEKGVKEKKQLLHKQILIGYKLNN